MRIRVNFERPKEVCYIGHIDLTRAITRGLRRSSLPLKFTEGFNQRVKVEMGFPLSVGIIGEDEYFDFYLDKNLPENIILVALSKAFDKILNIRRIKVIPESAPAITSLGAILTHFAYGKLLSNSSEKDIEKVLSGILNRREIVITRKKGRNTKSKDIRPFLKDIKLLNINPDNETIFLLSVYFTNKGSAKIDELTGLILKEGIDIKFLYTVRKKTMVIHNGKIVSPMDF